MRTALVAAAFLLASLAACSHGSNDTPVDTAQIDGADIDAPAIDAPNIDARIIDAAVDAVDAMPTPSELIGFARAAADGAATLPIMDATVTYVRPLVGGDPAGFTIQVVQQGPALLIAVDPATLTPTPAVGDTVSFTITNMATSNGQRRATAISGYTRTATGGNVTPLVQDLTAASDVVSAIGNYDSELVTVTGTVAGTFANLGAGFQGAAVDTVNLTGNANYIIRLPTTLRDSLDLATGCHFVLSPTPIYRFNTQAELQPYVSSELTVSQCPAPVVTNAVALSATQIRVDFSRLIQPSSVMADGSQFTLDMGLTVSAAVVSGRSVTLTTSAQTGGTDYLLTVAQTITDQAGTALGTPNTFTPIPGFVTRAVVRINELNTNIGNSCDLIELRVVSGGSMTGFHIQERVGNTTLMNPELNFTFPALNVPTNAIIVVHENSASATCNPNTATQETTAPNQQLAASFAGNYDSAYDIWVSDAGLIGTDNVITLYDSNNTIIDAVFASDDPAGATAATNTETQAAAVGAANQWSPMMATYIDTVFRTNAVDDLNATGTSATGTSIQRINDADTNAKTDWTTGAGATQTWGLKNAGQNDF